MIGLHRIFILWIIALSGCCIHSANAQRLIGKADKNKVKTGEPIMLTYQLEGEIGSRFSPPELPKDAFDILSGPNQTIQMQSSGGNVTRSISYNYIISPLSPGTYAIPPAKIWLKGKEISSNILQINVEPGSTSQGGGGNQPSPAPSAINSDTEQGEIEKRLKENLIIKAETEKLTVYQGEPLIVTYRLYKRETISPSIRMSMPVFNHFWTEDIPATDKGKIGVLNGKNYEIFEIRKMLVIPQQSGTLFLPELGCETEIILKDKALRMPTLSDLLNGRFPDIGIQQIPYTVVSERVPLTVKPLPETGKPASFEGLIGKYGITAEISPSEVKTDEPVHLNITLTGIGNLKMAQAPRLSLPDGWESFEPDRKDLITGNQNGTEGSVTFEYTLAASKAGEYLLPPTEVSFFNPESGTYETMKTAAFPLKVLQGENQGSPPDTTTSTHNIFSDSIQGIKQAIENHQLWIAVLLVSLIGGIGFLYLRHKKTKPLTATIQTPKEISTPIISVETMLGNAGQLQGIAFYETLSLALKNAVKEAFLLPYASFSPEELQQKWEMYQFPHSLRQQYYYLSGLCTQAVYTPIFPTEDKNKVLNQADTWINNMKEAVAAAKPIFNYPISEEDLL